MKFIKTSDMETANKLRQNGLTELAKEGNFFVFISDNKLNFSKEINDKIIYTNKLCV